MSEAESTSGEGATAAWPKAAASAVVFRGDCVLLAERGKGARVGLWSLPGGHIEPGETAEAAARREVLEETGIEVSIVGDASVHDVIIRNRDGELVAHYLIAVFTGTARPGEPVAASDCRAARFVPLDKIGSYRLTPGTERVIIEAARRIAAANHCHIASEEHP